MPDTIIKKAKTWLDESYDIETRKQVEYLMNNNIEELTESFYKDLEFGTGGLRGIMGVGTNRVNKYTIGAATQGLSNYMLKNFTDLKEIKVAVAFDCRNNSPYFGQIVADVFSANGIKVFLFESLRPTPELSFAIRELGCQSGVVITASHNPKEYNGYKAYWDDGAQVVPPHDKNIISEVKAIKSAGQIKFDSVKENIKTLGKEFDDLYIKMLKTVSLSPDIIKRNADLKIIYTPIHGTGVELVPKALKLFGFKNIINIPEQDIVDGDFPTVISPNPENAEALKLALQKAEETDADLVMATDPDADRVGIAVKNNKNEFILLNGNQTASVLIYYLIKRRSDLGLMKGNEYIVKTIVTSELLTDIASKFNIEHYDTLTGFKYIAEIIKQNEGKKLFIGGGEESYGYLAGEFVRDKDAVMSAALIAEAAAWAKDNGKSFFEVLQDIYVEFSFYKEELINLVKKGKEGAEEIQKMMRDFREKPPKSLGGSKVIEIKDYLLQQTENLVSESIEPITLPKSNVIQYITDAGYKISVRPSGTEPKIKFYVSIKQNLESKDQYEATNNSLKQIIEEIKNDLGSS